MRRHSRRSLPIAFGLAGVTALTIGGIGVAHVSPAYASLDDELEAVLGEPMLTVSENDSLVAVNEVVADTGQATVTGETSEGESFNVTTLLAPPEALEPVEASLEADTVASQDYTEDSPGLVLDVPEVSEITPEEAARFIPVSTSVTTDSAFSLAWAPTADAVTYRITFEGSSVTQSSTEFRIDDLRPGTSTSLMVESLDDQGSILYSRIVPIQTSDTEDGESGVEALTYQPYTTAYTHEAFIAQNRVRANIAESIGCTLNPALNYEFGGDNRSYRTPDAWTWPYDEPDYRTMTMTVINWDNPASSRIINGRGIQPTRLYLNGVLQESRTASYDGIVASGMSLSSSYAQVHWSVDVANAFCWAGAIRYETDVRFYRNGSIEVVGYRRQAPVHEIYGRWNNTGTDFFRTITRLPNNGFNCLDEIQCQLETINRSVQY